MDPEIKFFFWLGAVICFVVAALGEAWRFGRYSRQNLPARIVLVPLGLALFVFPLMWDTGVEAW